jgi:hypothetical protein
MRTRWVSFAGLLLGLALPLGLAAQGTGTADIPLDDNAYTYIDALLNRGVLRSLSSLERPYSLAEVRAALDRDHARIDASRTLIGYATGLRRALKKYDAGTYDARLHRPTQDSSRTALMRYQLGADIYATAQTSSIREVMEDNGEHAVYPGGDIRALAEMGPVTVFFRPIVDGRLLQDPQFMIGDHPKDNARVQDGYIDARWPFAEVFFGRESRNWGPPDLSGLLLGDYVYSYDHLYARIGPRALHLQMIVARLNDVVYGGDTVAERYFSIHRLETSWHTFEFALTEAIVYGGPGQGFNLSYINPVNIFWFSQLNETTARPSPYGTNGSKKVSAEIAWRSRTLGNFSGQFYLDNYEFTENSCLPVCGKPNSFGLTAEVDGFPFIGQQRLFGYYTLVSNLSYRNDNPYEAYDEWGLGLGRGYADYDEARLGIDLAAVPRVPLKLYASYRRQGQGSYLNLIPPPDSLLTTPTIFSGIVSHIERVGLSGAVTIPYFEISGDVGVNHATNYNNLAGVTRTSIAGTIKASLVISRLFGGAISPPRD